MKVSPRAILAFFLISLSVGHAQAGNGHRYHGHGHHGHSSFGVFIGSPWGPWGYPPPVYYPPRVIVLPAPEPPVYIEQGSLGRADQYWYFCQQSGAYYPQVSQCPGGWIRVPPRP
jgi:hypothetical protein